MHKRADKGGWFKSGDRAARGGVQIGLFQRDVSEQHAAFAVIWIERSKTPQTLGPLGLAV